MRWIPIHGWVVIAAYEMGGLMRGVIENVQKAGYPIVVVDNGFDGCHF
jgi:hypothetical protein